MEAREVLVFEAHLNVARDRIGEPAEPRRGVEVHRLAESRATDNHRDAPVLVLNRRDDLHVVNIERPPRPVDVVLDRHVIVQVQGPLFAVLALELHAQEFVSGFLIEGVGGDNVFHAVPINSRETCQAILVPSGYARSRIVESVCERLSPTCVQRALVKDPAGDFAVPLDVMPEAPPARRLRILRLPAPEDVVQEVLGLLGRFLFFHPVEGNLERDRRVAENCDLCIRVVPDRERMEVVFLLRVERTEDIGMLAVIPADVLADAGRDGLPPALVLRDRIHDFGFLRFFRWFVPRLVLRFAVGWVEQVAEHDGRAHVLVNQGVQLFEHIGRQRGEHVPHIVRAHDIDHLLDLIEDGEHHIRRFRRRRRGSHRRPAHSGRHRRSAATGRHWHESH